MGESPVFVGRLRIRPRVQLEHAHTTDPIERARAAVPLSLITRSGIRKRQTVLVVDDEASIRLLVHSTIESPSYQVIEARDGEEAWTLIKERKPALVLLDVKMPLRSGFEILTSIRADPELRGTQVMMLTASDRQVDIDRGILAGAGVESRVGAPSRRRPWNSGQGDIRAHPPSSNPHEASAVTESRSIAQTVAPLGRMAAASGGEGRRGLKTVPSRSRA